MDQFDWYSYIRVSLIDIATCGSVSLILLHMFQVDWYIYICSSLTEIATYGSVRVKLLHTGQFTDITIYG